MTWDVLGKGIRVELHVSLLEHVLPAIDVLDPPEEVLPDVCQVHRLHSMGVVRHPAHVGCWL